MKLSEFILILILAIILSVSKISDSLKNDKEGFTNSSIANNANFISDSTNNENFNEISLRFDPKNQKLIFFNNTTYTNTHFSD